MRKALVTMAAVAIVAVLTVRAQDARATLDAAAKAMGSDRVNSIQFSGNGMNAAFGQAFKAGGPWPAFKVTSYTASIDYSVPAMRIELERTNPDGKIEGGGGLPLVAPQKQVQAVSKRAAWNVVNGTPAPALATLRDRQIALWTTPHGVIKAAMANAATVTGRVIAFSVSGVNFQATLGADNLISKVETTADALVLGDTVTETTYSNYGDFAGVKFPRRIVQKQAGFPILDLTITDVQPNTSVSIEVPQPVLQTIASPGVTPVTVTTTKVGDGVFYLTGGSHHSMAVEFKDYSVLFEAPQTDERAMAIIDATKTAIPNKPIRYVINSHNHFDHLGGIRAVMAEGITVITQARNKDYYEKIALMPHTINPDRLAKSPKKPVIETVEEKRVITDGAQTLEIYRLPSMHSETLLIGYLPKQKILYEVDVFNAPAVPAPNAPAAAALPPSPATVEFVTNIEKMKLDVDQILAAHGGRVATMKDLRVSAGRVPTY
jgi:glyoxylase-like metal-dependent hydrolase (beta-lactamase superfamily II)